MLNRLIQLRKRFSGPVISANLQQQCIPEIEELCHPWAERQTCFFSLFTIWHLGVYPPPPWSFGIMGLSHKSPLKYSG